MKRLSLPWLTTPLLFALASPYVQAQNLGNLYEIARTYDATFLAAKAELNANVALVEQAKGAFLPQIGFSSTISRSDFTPKEGFTNMQQRMFSTQNYGFTLSQPIYRPGSLATFNQAQKQLLMSDAAMQAAEQDLIMRLAQAYFDLLMSYDSLRFVRSQKAAVSQQLAAAKRNFDVGTATITDANEAQARFDLSHAQEIAAENDLRLKHLTLNHLVGRPVRPQALRADAQLPALSVSEIGQWVETALQNHPSVRTAQMALDVAILESEKSRAGHKPTIDGFISATNNNNIGGNALSPNPTRSFIGQAGVTLNMPIFSGFSTQYRLKQTLALEEKARHDLDAARRAITQATQAAYLGALSSLGAVTAYEAAEKSSKTALDANQLGYQVGVRINIDVLNAQSQLYQAKRDLAVARYNVLLGQLKLRQASGSLKETDLSAINALLTGIDIELETAGANNKPTNPALNVDKATVAPIAPMMMPMMPTPTTASPLPATAPTLQYAPPSVLLRHDAALQKR